MGYGLTKRESVILTWGGLRGALAMTLALMVSYTEAIPEDIRNQILFFTAGIVTLTLCINATTMRWLLNKMGLISVPSARVKLEYNIHKHIRENSEKYLERLKARDHSHLQSHIRRRYHIGNSFPPVDELTGRAVRP